MAGLRYPGREQCFWIDVTEVTVADYSAFLEAMSGGGAPVAEYPCEANDGLTPHADCLEQASQAQAGAAGAGGHEEAPVGGQAEAPVVCVDWCDAKAYCNWAGKRLCSDAFNELHDASQSEWYAACSNGRDDDYPCGSGAQACNGALESAGTVVGVGVYDQCRSDAGVFDLSGNVAEWTDACSQTSGSADCQLRGGSFASDSAAKLECDAGLRAPRMKGQRYVGFRCCADA